MPATVERSVERLVIEAAVVPAWEACIAVALGATRLASHEGTHTAVPAVKAIDAETAVDRDFRHTVAQKAEEIVKSVTFPAYPGGVFDRQAGGFAKQGPSPVPAPPHSDPTIPVGAPSPLRRSVRFALHLSRGLNTREHHMHRASRVKRERLVTAWALHAAGFPRGLKVTSVTLMRYARGTLDTDNLQGAFKAVRDAVADYLRTNDGPKSGIEWRYGQGYNNCADVSITFELQEQQ